MGLWWCGTFSLSFALLLHAFHAKFGVQAGISLTADRRFYRLESRVGRDEAYAGGSIQLSDDNSEQKWREKTWLATEEPKTEPIERKAFYERKHVLRRSVRGAPSYRTEYRRGAGEEAKGAHPRQSDPHLDTSTFALSGDSAHNQAMVHWSGHNSSVSFSPVTLLKSQPVFNILTLLSTLDFYARTVSVRKGSFGSKNCNVSVQ